MRKSKRDQKEFFQKLERGEFDESNDKPKEPKLLARKIKDLVRYSECCHEHMISPIHFMSAEFVSTRSHDTTEWIAGNRRRLFRHPRGVHRHAGDEAAVQPVLVLRALRGEEGGRGGEAAQAEGTEEGGEGRADSSVTSTSLHCDFLLRLL